MQFCIETRVDIYVFSMPYKTQWTIKVGKVVLLKKKSYALT